MCGCNKGTTRPVASRPRQTQPAQIADTATLDVDGLRDDEDDAEFATTAQVEQPLRPALFIQPRRGGINFLLQR